MTELYPFKFDPILKEKIWGGNSLKENYGKHADSGRLVGESWEISAVAGDISTISNGFLAGNNLQEIIEVYMGDITGDVVYEKFGDEFPLLIKLIEAKEDLSVQVHPGDKLAKERHKAYGKTEMWYILESKEDAKIYSGFKEQISRKIYNDSLRAGNLPDLLNVEIPQAGDVFFTPAGRIHSIGAGTVLAEIQQTSDITYRIFDWNRKGLNGEPRELHTELAEDAIDYNEYGNCVIRKDIPPDKTINLVSCDHFITNILDFKNPVKKDYNFLDSFVVYICTDGNFIINWGKGSETVSKGETVMLPSVLSDIVLEPKPAAIILEIYINTNYNHNNLS